MVSGGVIGTGHGPGAEQYSEEEVAIVTSLAHAEGKRVAAHAHGEPSIRNAVRGGVDTVEHASFVTAELIGEMLERGTFVVPTLAVIHFVIESASEALGEETLQRAREVAEVHHANISAAWRAGIPIVAGTDMGSPFTGPDAIHEEIARLTGIGMSNHEAIQAATLQGARAVGVEDDLGTVRPRPPRRPARARRRPARRHHGDAARPPPAAGRRVAHPRRRRGGGERQRHDAGPTLAARKHARFEPPALPRAARGGRRGGSARRLLRRGRRQRVVGGCTRIRGRSSRTARPASNPASS